MGRAAESVSILIVAPRQPNLPTLDDEVSALVRAFHRPILVQGVVTEAELQRALTPDIEALWFAGHAGPEGIMLSNELLPPQALAQYLSSAGIEWSFFNSCDSSSFVDRLQAAYPHDCYASITLIGDSTAWRTALLVAMNYSNVGDVEAAFRMASPAGSTPLRFFPNPTGGRVSQKELDSVEQLAAEIRELRKVLVGDDRYRIRGIINDVRFMEKRQDRMETWLRLNIFGWIALILIDIVMRIWR